MIGTDGYDRIASIYDLDMGASMRLDDVGHYRQLALAASGPVLELGCGTGRILAALARAGVDAWGVDRSLPMLRRARSRCGPAARLIQADMRALPLRGGFALAILAYSLPTLLLDEADWRNLARGLRAALRPDGQVVLDAFIPQPALADRGWLRDYARRAGDHWLVRHKRISTCADGSHRIERRYRLRGQFAGRTLCTSERIRPLAPEQLIALGRAHFGALQQLSFDYLPGGPRRGARFCTAVFRLDRAGLSQDDSCAAPALAAE